MAGFHLLSFLIGVVVGIFGKKPLKILAKKCL
jgi:hypothetical protein